MTQAQSAQDLDATEGAQASHLAQQAPTLKIASISRDGLVVLSFSEPLLVIENMSELTDAVLEVNDSTARQIHHPGVELTIAPLEDDQSAESVGFSWEPQNFTETQLAIQLSFDFMYEISAYSEPNELQVTIWNESLFVSKAHRLAVQKGSKLVSELPQMQDANKVESFKAMAEVISYVGKSSIGLAFTVSFCLKILLNQLLSQVRSLQLITHLMIMQLNYPIEAAAFYAGLFELVTFDLLPMDDIYGELFEFPRDKPYSAQAEVIGYGSRYLILNLGSISVFVALLGLT